MTNLLKPNEVDLMLRYPSGRSARLARAGRLPCVVLPDGSLRFREPDIQRLIGDVYDINCEDGDGQSDRQATDR